MLEYEDYIKKMSLGEVYINKSFKDVTTLKIGGEIMLLYYPNTIENFITFYKYYTNNNIKNYKLMIIGNGSNILASSNKYNGIVVSFKKIIYKYSIINNYVYVSSGVMMMDLINYVKKYNLSGLERLSYIPATIGGMVKMNAGAYKSNISDNLVYIKCINEYGNIIKYDKNDIVFKYRNCNINNKNIIIECVFELNKKEESDINKTIDFIKTNRINKQPLNNYNAGSTFKNYNNIKAWELIDKLGFRGYSINDAMVSNKHCNFLINKKNCKSEDMIKLINNIIDKVYYEYNIKLECEWILINF